MAACSGGVRTLDGTHSMLQLTMPAQSPQGESVGIGALLPSAGSENLRDGAHPFFLVFGAGGGMKRDVSQN